MLTLIGFDVDAAFRSGPVIEIADAQRMLLAVRRFAQIAAPPALNVIDPELPVTTGGACLRYLDMGVLSFIREQLPSHRCQIKWGKSCLSPQAYLGASSCPDSRRQLCLGMELCSLQIGY